MRRALCAAWGAALLCFASAAWGHAILVESQPSEGAEVAGPDVAMSLEFNSRIDASRSSVLLARDAAGQPLPPVGQGAQSLALEPGDSPNKLSAQLKHLAPGAYRLRWQVLSVDGHVSRGDVKFRVRAP